MTTYKMDFVETNMNKLPDEVFSSPLFVSLFLSVTL